MIKKSLILALAALFGISPVVGTQGEGQSWIKKDSHELASVAMPADSDYKPNASTATRYLFLAVFKHDVSGVVFFLRNGADANHILTHYDAYLLDRLARREIPGYTSTDSLFHEGTTIAQLLIQERLDWETEHSVHQNYPSRILQELILSGKMNADQIAYIIEYYEKEASSTTGLWAQHRIKCIKELVEKSKQNEAQN